MDFTNLPITELGYHQKLQTAYAETLLKVTWRYLRRYHTAGTFRSAGPKTYFVEILEPLGSVEDGILGRYFYVGCWLRYPCLYDREPQQS